MIKSFEWWHLLLLLKTLALYRHVAIEGAREQLPLKLPYCPQQIYLKFFVDFICDYCTRYKWGYKPKKISASSARSIAHSQNGGAARDCNS